MSELKVINLGDIRWSIENNKPVHYDYYAKSEADKVIAELEESHKKEVRQLLILNREQANSANRLRDSMEQVIRHHKYKRCLAMADFCESEYNRCYAVGNGFWLVRGDKETRDKYRKKADDFWWKWHKRWLELAEKFKEVK